MKAGWSSAQATEHGWNGEEDKYSKAGECAEAIDQR